MRVNSEIRDFQKRLSLLNEERTRYIFSLTQGKDMVLGLPLEVYRKCGKAGCKCNDGKRHGPYPALSVNKDGKQKIVMVKKKDAATVIKKSKRYRHYQQTLAKIRRLNRDIDELLEQLKAAMTRSYP